MDTEDGFYWTLSPDSFEATRAKVEKLNARAVKKGFTGRLELVGEQTIYKRDTAIGVVEEIVYRCRIDGEAPSYNGWTLLASVDFIETGCIVNTAPGVTKVDRSLTEQGKCDHCKVNRYRAKAYLVTDGTRQLQVGSTCLKDFLGWSALPAYVSTDSVKEDVDGFLSDGYWPRTWATESVLAAAWATIKLDGYVRSGDWERTPTKSMVGSLLDPKGKDAHKIRARYGALTEESFDVARKTREFILSDDFAGDNEYVINMKTALSADSVQPKHFGLVVSAPQAWYRHQEKTLIKERQKADYVDEFLGEIKQRLRGLRVQVKLIKWLNNPYGDEQKPLYTMVTDTGHMVKWFASEDKLGEDVTDEWFTLDGTVKKHDIWNGQKSTVITNCRVKN